MEADNTSSMMLEMERVNRSELLYLIFSYLKSVPFRDNTELLESTRRLEHAVEKGNQLGTTTTWTGATRPTSFVDLNQRYKELDGAHLENILDALLQKQCLGKGERDNGSSIVTSEGNKPLARLSLLGNFPLDSSSSKININAVGKQELKLVNCRSESRMIEAELMELEAQLKKAAKGKSRKVVFAGPDEDSSIKGHGTPTTRTKLLERRKNELILKGEKLRNEIRPLVKQLKQASFRRRRKLQNSADIVDNMRTNGLNASATRRTTSKVRKVLLESSLSKITIMKTITGHTSNVYCVKTDHSGRWVVTGSDDYLVKLWNAKTALLCCTYRGHTGCISDIAIDKTNTLLATSSLDATIRLWELLTGRPLSVLASHTKPVGPLEFDPYEGLLISTADDGTCCVWDAERIVDNVNRRANTNPDTLSDVTGLEREVLSSPGGGRDEEAAFSSPRSTGPVLSAQALAEAGFANEFIAAASGISNLMEDDDSAASLYRDRLRGEKIPIVLPHLDMNANRVDVGCVSVRPGGGYIVTGSDDGFGRVWAIQREKPKKCRQTPNAMTVSELVKGQYIDGSSRLVCMLRGHCSPITHVSWSHHGDRILSGSVKDGTVRIWYWTERNSSFRSSESLEPNIWSTPHHRVLSIQIQNNFAPSLSHVMGGRSGPGSRSRVSGSGRPRSSKMPTLDACSWNADDSRVITMQSIAIRTPASPEAQMEARLNPNIFSDQQVKVWDPLTGQVLHTLRAHRRTGSCITPHPQFAHVVVTIAEDGLICIWDVMNGKLIRKLTSPSLFGPVPILDAVFSPAGSSPADLLATDAYGRLLFIGDAPNLNAVPNRTENSRRTSGCVPYHGAPSEQFFENDFGELVHDSNQNALDARTSLPTHLVPPTKLCDSQMNPYHVQPPPRKKGEGSYLVNSIDFSLKQLQDNLVARSLMVKPLERSLRQRELNLMESLEESFRKMDQRIEEERSKDKGAAPINRNRSRFSSQSQNNPSHHPRSRPPGRNRARARPGGLLACEIDELENDEEQKRTPRSRNRGDATNDDGSTSRGTDSVTATVVNNDDTETGGEENRRSRRGAAQRAQGMIRQFQQYEERREFDSESEEDQTDEQWDGTDLYEESPDKAFLSAASRARLQTQRRQARPTRPQRDQNQDQNNARARATGSVENNNNNNEQKKANQRGKRKKKSYQAPSRSSNGSPSSSRKVSTRTRRSGRQGRRSGRVSNYATFFEYDSAEFTDTDSQSEEVIESEQKSSESDEEGSSEEGSDEDIDDLAERVNLREIRSARVRAKIREEQEKKKKARLERKRRREEKQKMKKVKHKTKEEKQRRKEKEKQKVTKTKTTNNKNFGQEFTVSREWLNSIEPHCAGLSYLPQKGDTIVYCVQGHQEYLKYYPISEAPPWRSETLHWRIPDWPYVLCRIDDISYAFPTSSMSDEAPVMMIIGLSMLAVPLKNASSRRLWYDLPQKPQFHISLQPHNLPEFLILQERFEKGSKTQFAVGDVVRAAFTGENGNIEFYQGEIIAKVDYDAEQWPNSPWASLEITYDEGGDERFSPWEIQKMTSPEGEWNEPFYFMENVNLSFELCDAIHQKIEDIEQNDIEIAAPFTEPVDLNQVEGYTDVIALPVDLSIIKKRLKTRFYRSLEAIKHDVELIRINCELFNTEDSPIVTKAQELEGLLLDAIEDPSCKTRRIGGEQSMNPEQNPRNERKRKLDSQEDKENRRVRRSNRLR